MTDTIAARIAEVEHAFKQFRIPHPRLLMVRERIDTMRHVARKAAETGAPMPQKFLPIIAPSGSGKSTCVLDYIETVVAKEKLADGQRPVVHVTLSAKATTKRLSSDILEAFGDPSFERGTAEQLMRRAYNHLGLARTEVLVLDEIQHLISTDTKKVTAWTVTETIKRMLIQGVCPMVLIGTPEARPVLMTNPQMKSRCLEPILLDPLDITDPAESAMFLDHCGGLDMKMVEHRIFKEYSGLVGGDIPQCLFEVSKGVIGTVSNVVMVAAGYAIKAKARSVGRDHLDAAVQKWAIPLGITDRNPFRNGGRTLSVREVA